jgi:hypothetical protein
VITGGATLDGLVAEGRCDPDGGGAESLEVVEALGQPGKVSPVEMGDRSGIKPVVVAPPGHAALVVVGSPVGKPVGEQKIEDLPAARLRGTSQAEARRGARSGRKRGDGKSEQTGKTQGPEGHRGRVNVGAGRVHVKGGGSENSSIHGKILRSERLRGRPGSARLRPAPRERPLAPPWSRCHLRVFRSIAEFCRPCRWPSAEPAGSLGFRRAATASLAAGPCPFLDAGPARVPPSAPPD